MAISLALRGQSKSTSGIFITDRIKQGELEVNYCHNEDMIADYFTKPLQGQHFIKFRKSIVNLRD